MNRKVLRIIGIVAGSIACFMLFILPFLLPDSLSNNKTFVWIAFPCFLIMIATGNITLEKSLKPFKLNELRREKLKRINGKT